MEEVLEKLDRNAELVEEIYGFDKNIFKYMVLASVTSSPAYQIYLSEKRIKRYKLRLFLIDTFTILVFVTFIIIALTKGAGLSGF